MFRFDPRTGAARASGPRGGSGGGRQTKTPYRRCGFGRGSRSTSISWKLRKSGSSPKNAPGKLRSTNLRCGEFGGKSCTNTAHGFPDRKRSIARFSARKSFGPSMRTASPLLQLFRQNFPGITVEKFDVAFVFQFRFGGRSVLGFALVLDAHNSRLGKTAGQE